MDVLRPLDDSDSVFLLLTKRLNLLKFHELLNKIQEFMAGLREEDLTDVLLNYNPVPQPHPTQVQAQPPVQTQPQPQPQLQPQQQVQHQLQPPLQAQVQPPVQQQVQVQAQPQPQVQTQTQPQLPIQQQQLPKLQQTQPQIQPQIQINHPQKQVSEPYYQPQTIQYEGPQPVKKVKMDQLAHSETNNQQAAAPMDNGGYNQQKHNAMKPELPRTTYSEYEEYDQAKDTWRISGQQSSHGNMNLSNFSSSFRGGQSYPPLNAMSTISSMSTMSSLNTLSTMTADIQQPRTKSINYYQEDSMPSHPSDTPKFPNQHTLAAYVEKIWKENPTLQENNDIVERNDKSHNFNSKSYPVFESSFVKIDPPNFYVDAVKPGLVSKKLSQALGMASEKEAPPYLSKLLKVGLPGTYREETFYGINARVPKDFDKESWLKAGVSPTMFETEKMDMVAQQDVQNKSKNKEGEAHIPGVLSDTDYLDRFLRKPQTFYGKTGAPLKTIEIDD